MYSVYSTAIGNWVGEVDFYEYLFKILIRIVFFLEPDQQIVWRHILDTHWVSYTPRQRCSRCILQPKPTGPSRTILGVNLPSCRYAVGIFYSPSRLSHLGHSYGDFSFLQRYSWFILLSRPTEPSKTLFGWVLHSCRDVVGIWLAHTGHSLG